jgi:hypothetical protein
MGEQASMKMLLSHLFWIGGNGDDVCEVAWVPSMADYQTYIKCCSIQSYSLLPSPTNLLLHSHTHTSPDLHQSPATFHTMKYSAIAAAAIGALAVQATPIKRAATITDTDILQYALTLEHLEK